MKNNFQNLKITETQIFQDSFILQKFLYTTWQIISAKIRWNIFFFFFEKKFFEELEAFFTTAKPLI